MHLHSVGLLIQVCLFANLIAQQVKIVYLLKQLFAFAKVQVVPSILLLISRPLLFGFSFRPFLRSFEVSKTKLTFYFLLTVGLDLFFLSFGLVSELKLDGGELEPLFDNELLDDLPFFVTDLLSDLDYEFS